MMSPHMKTTTWHVLWAMALWPGALGAAPATPSPTAAPSPEVILRWHFAGLNSLLADTNAAKLKRIWSLPATAGLRQQAFDQLARAPFLALGSQLGKGLADQSALFRPLLEDLLPGESFLEWRGPAGQPTEAVLSLQLGEERVRLWRENLRQALEKWKLGTVSDLPGAGTPGWVLKHRDGKSAFACARSGQWLVLGLGPASLPLHAQTLERIKTDGRPGLKPTAHWLVADANLERLKPWLPPLAPYAHPPLAHLALSNRADNVLTSVEIFFPQGHGFRSEPWIIPAGLMRESLISFTVAQGIAPLLQPWKSFQQLAINPPPSQVTLWANTAYPFLNYLAVPMKNAGPELIRMAPQLRSMTVANTNLAVKADVGWDTNGHALVLTGLPVVQPRLLAIKTAEAGFLVGGLAPLPRGTNPPPPGLLEQVQNRSDVVYYDWEITEARLRQWRPLYQVLDLATGRSLAPTNAPTQRWLAAVAPLLGNSATEITVISPTQFSLARKSHCGLTGFELVSLVRWLDSPEFPRLSVLGPPHKTPAVKKDKPKTR
jgi:hypothetical protein